MKIEDEYADVLQSIETVVVSTFRKNPDMTDYDVDKVYSALIQTYHGEAEGRPVKKPTGDLSILMDEQMMEICNWYLGRTPTPDKKGKSLPAPRLLTVEEVILCLKHLRASIEKWTKENGRQGYLDYINQFFPKLD